MVEDYKKYYYGRTDMIMLNDEKVYGSLGINLKEVTTIVEGYGSVVLHNSLKKPFRKFELLGNSTQLTTTGKNLFNPKQLQGISGFTIEGNEITQSGYNVSTGKTLKQLCPEITPGTYILSANNGDFTGLFGITKPMYKKSAIEIVDEDLNRIVSLVGNPNKTIKYTLQIEKGNTVTPYEPYTGGKPSPSPEYPQEIKSAGRFDEASGKYLLDVKVTGKNLFNAEKAKDANNWTSSAILPSYKEFSIYVGKGNSVNISYLENLETGLGFYANIAHSKNDYTMYWLYHSDSEINITKNKNFIAMNDYIVLRVDAGSVPKFFEYIKTLQIEIGSKQTPYEPYTEQSMQIALDEPLRGVGEYKDVLTKDGVVRKIYPPYEINLNDLRDGGYSRTNTVMFSVKVQNKTVGYASLKPSILCNILPDCGLQTGNIYNDDKECIAVGNMYVLFRVNKSRLKDISSFEAAKQSFIEYMADKKMIVEYALETPTTEPLPESAQQQLQALHSENGTTHVFVDSGEVEAGINIEYVVGA